MKFRPLEDRILVKRIEEKEQKHGNVPPESGHQPPW
jgi:co-chaperonin GroES (HSP10)